ncbi:hypothetical protein [Micropruina sonneratiae]|uniref:hypothetical protein n=1 Tax=Micropruina sonneratiae TaxID=2986940 RepID=UPI0022276557|nr:hypothetical protein [Micropruina sp. KQZ13P-5]MCW3158525.1 hypothetical protein [Micropruina sp. KQZ13P-5]
MLRSCPPATAVARFGLRAAAAGVSALAGLAVLPGLTPSAQAVPIRTENGWSVLLCKMSDVSGEPQTKTFFKQFFGSAGAGMKGLYDYFLNQSYGKVAINADVRGWYTMPYTQAQEAGKSRWDKINDCVNTAANAGYSVPAGNRIAVIINAQMDSGASGGRVLLDPGAWNVRFASHEMLHGYDLGHSFSNDTSYQNATWSQPGEYDDMWDQMSAQHVYSFDTGTFGEAGVGMNAYNRDKLGWLPMDRVRTFGSGGGSSGVVRLAPLQKRSRSGSLLVRVPFNPGDLYNYYTVEYQSKSGWTKGIPKSTVLIHEVKNGTPTLLRALNTAGKPPAQSISANGVTIKVLTTGSTATVQITSQIADRCLQGWVWREARASDHVCVTGATRSQVAADNAVKASRWVNGAYGPHTCVQGYVWREAFSGDDVCVTGAQRTQAKADNAQASARRNPARLVYGPNTCAPGYVWRQGDAADYVCVTGATRAQVANDNAVKASRWVNGAYGAHTCRQGYVWREAWVGDDVCVTGAQRSQARADNAQTRNRVANPAG